MTSQAPVSVVSAGITGKAGTGVEVGKGEGWGRGSPGKRDVLFLLELVVGVLGMGVG